MSQAALFAETGGGPKYAAVFSATERYRFVWTAWLGESPRVLVAICLNPSTADAFKTDPTVRWLMRWAQKHGYGRLTVLNLFAWRTTNPAELRKVADPVGREFNDGHIREWASRYPEDVICAWGIHGRYLNREDEVKGLLREIGVTPRAFGFTMYGCPKHPLYQRSSIEAAPWPL